MTQSDIAEELIKIAKDLKVKDKDIEREANLFSEGIFDSMDAIEYMISIEEKFNVKIDDEIVRYYKLGTISSMSEYILSKKK